jgi:hypothetical protein
MNKDDLIEMIYGFNQGIMFKEGAKETVRGKGDYLGRNDQARLSILICLAEKSRSLHLVKFFGNFVQYILNRHTTGVMAELSTSNHEPDREVAV